MLEWRWGRPQRALLAETLRDLANIAAGALVFGQVLGERGFSPWLALAGLACWCALVVLAFLATGGRQT